MLPWNYGFHWNTATMIFMGAFYAVVTVVAGTVLNAARRSWRVLRTQKAEHVRWDSEFHDLVAGDRACRHALTGELAGRVCPNGFDCRECEMHRKLIPLIRQDDVPVVEEEIFGLSFPSGRLYHRGHAWVHPEADGTLTIGLDDLAQRLVSNPDRVSLPKAGQRVHVNGTAWRARKRNAVVRVLSPVDGEVVETGGPGKGWYLRVKPENSDLRHLLCPHEVKPWIQRELERLQLALAAEGAAPTLADGGVPVADIAAAYPEADWDAICGRIFLQP